MRLVLPATALLATVLTACGSQPGISVSAGTQSIPMVAMSTTRITGWWLGEHGDAAWVERPLSVIRTSAPVTLRFAAGEGATEIRGWVYDTDRPSLSGGPIEEFSLPGRTGAYEPRAIAAGRTYEVVVNVKWSGLLVHGEETHAFRLRLEAP
jgi:hypothetical protein